MQHPQPTYFEVCGTAIREDRMSAGLDTSELARRAGFSRRYLSHLENGTRRQLAPSKYAALRTALGSTDERLLVQRTQLPKE
ncbi:MULTISPECIES: helix-turn-helix domain-containing protein [unclassified Streptomyces]|uniref:helix-turn-helix domain-containing protein n=1 Tax=unclassified Streptomyces TaxID=2593676 RepID=UPI00381B93E5